tara:strand:- start:1117 stop:1923 length:807 start_codon:yes stop_codon:yes gene_type:complete
MHYYQFNIGDYAKSTKHLTLLEDLAYRRLLDIYYDTEKPLNSNVKQLARIAGMSEYIDEITNVLADFFTETEEGFTQKKAACEIDSYQSKAVVARVNGKLGGRPKKTQPEPKETQPVNSANPDETALKPNYKPLTINQEPLTTNQELSVKDKALSPKVDVILVNDIFNYWSQVMCKGSRTSLTTLRKTKISARLKDGYPVHEIKQAIDNVAKDSFLVAGGHTDIEMICRSDTNLEKYRDAVKMSNADMKMAQRQQSIEDFSNEGSYNE